MTSPRVRRLLTALELAVVGASTMLPTLWRSWTGSLRIPAGDAWAYERIVQVFHETGELHGVGWNDITLLGVLAPLWPWVKLFGFGRVQLAVLTSLFGGLGLLAVRDMLTVLRVRHGRLLLLTSVAAYGGIVGTAGTFLVDLYAFAGSIAAVALAVRLLKRTDDGQQWRTSMPIEIALTICSLFAFSVRQQSAVVPLALFLYLWRSGYPVRRVATMATAWAATAGAFYLWRQQLDHGGRLLYDFGPRSAVSGLIAMTVTVGLAVTPIVLATGAWRRVVGNRRLIMLAAGTAIVVVACAFSPLRGDVFLEGLDRLHSFPVPLRVLAYLMVGLASGVGAGSLAAAARRQTSEWLGPEHGRRIAVSTPSGPGLLALVMLAALVTETAVVIVSAFYSPRYSLMSVVLGAVLLTVGEGVDQPDRSESRATRWVAGVAVVLVAAVAYVGLDISSISARAWFTGAQRVRCLGIPAQRIDAGFGWDGLALGQADRAAGPRPDDGLPVGDGGSQYYPTLQRDALVSLVPVTTPEGVTTLPPVTIRGIIPGDKVTARMLIRSSVLADGGESSCTG